MPNPDPQTTIEELQRNVAIRNERILDLEETLGAAMRRFQFYADEHTKAGKLEKAKSNQEYADLCRTRLEKTIWE